MSKIFEALRRTEGDLAAMVESVLTDGTVPGVESRNEAIAGVTAPDENVAAREPHNTHTEVRSQSIELVLDSHILPFDGRDDRAAEQYRIIRTKIQHHPLEPQILLVSSPMPADGKTLNAINLAASLSLQENLRVLLMDCDFWRFSATRQLGITGSPGLGEVVRNEASIESALVRISQFPNLYVLPPGDARPGPAELLSTARWQSLVETFRSEFRFVVIDAPPIGTVAEYELLQFACDGVLLVVRQDHTNRQLCQRALEAVPKDKRLGVILNCVRPWFFWKTQSYYYDYSAGSR